MYEDYFGLKSKPFELTPNPDFLYRSDSHQHALDFLHYGLKERAGFVLLTGEVGLGKTTVLRNMIRQLKSGVVLATIFNTQAAPDQLLAMINDEFGLDVPAKSEKVTLLRELNDFLLDQYAQRIHPILIVDEAQNLSFDALEELRLLSNLETEDSKLLSIILSGQPELKNKLMRPELRQLRQRISVSCNLRNLTAEEMRAYIQHRLKQAGNEKAVIFEEAVFPVLFSRSRGIPRVINVLCDYLLLTAFSEETNRIDLKMTLEVADEIVPESATLPTTLPRPVSEVAAPAASSKTGNGAAGKSAGSDAIDASFLADTNNRLVQLVSGLDDQSKELNQRFDWLEKNLDEDLRTIRDHLKTLGGTLVRISNKLDKMT